ncbi:hypothetical protein RRG08_005086 [Elysia crispata]|uniref:Uncharacterized protein n=1 Tax=Elysia crispata TaxID=231223 RepID=A0AAE0XYL1_9GAST|nr:hypothetical protein RRG08_005086 [Elysia crispata]
MVWTRLISKEKDIRVLVGQRSQQLGQAFVLVQTKGKPPSTPEIWIIRHPSNPRTSSDQGEATIYTGDMDFRHPSNPRTSSDQREATIYTGDMDFPIPKQSSD